MLGDFDDVKEKVRRVHGLMDAPEFGLLSWNMMLSHAVQELYDALYASYRQSIGAVDRPPPPPPPPAPPSPYQEMWPQRQWPWSRETK
jgi:hypothetical protein